VAGITEREKLELSRPELVDIFAKEDARRSKRLADWEEVKATRVIAPLIIESREWRVIYTWFDSQELIEDAKSKIRAAGFEPEGTLYDTFEYVIRW